MWTSFVGRTSTSFVLVLQLVVIGVVAIVVNVDSLEVSYQSLYNGDGGTSFI